MNYIIVNGELCHHGVKGMKWGVRKAARIQTRAARGRRDIALSKAKNDEQRNAAKAKYKQEKRAIRLDMKAKISDINNQPDVTKGHKRAKRALGTLAGLTIGTAAVGTLAVIGAAKVGSAVSRGTQAIRDSEGLLGQLSVIF